MQSVVFIRTWRDDFLHKVGRICWGEPQKKGSTTSILNLVEGLSRKYLSAHFYDEIKSVVAENYSTQTRPPYIFLVFLNVVNMLPIIPR